MALAGGSADKVGNEYETWWTLRRVADLLRGSVDSMSVEPFGGDGAELWTESEGARSWDQVKFRSTGQWTVARIRNDGLLAKLRPHYETDASVLLVLSQPSDSLDRHIELARAVETSAQLWKAGSTDDLDMLADIWGADKDTTLKYLRQTSVRHDAPDLLREFVELDFERLVVGDVSAALGLLRQFLADNINKTFVAGHVWTELESHGIAARPLGSPGPTIAKLREGLDRYVGATRAAAPAAGMVTRMEVQQLVDLVESSTDHVILVEGRAGAGKSMVVAEAAAELAARGRPAGALRLDRADPSAATAEALGPSTGVEGSPVIALSEVSPVGFDGVLIIDQLDAVSAYSGRMPQVYDAVDELIRQARLLGNVRVVVAVRSVDLQQDPRLRRLTHEDAPTLLVGELDPDAVKIYLPQLGVDVAGVDATTLSLLRLPIHLYVFSQLDPTLWTTSFSSLNGLYEEYTKSFRAKLTRDGHQDVWPTLAAAMIERMNTAEALSVPRSGFDATPALYIEALISENVLVEESRRLSFFHETYFDYLFARSFDLRGDALVEWFASSGQGLFKRSQLRQVLAFIASEEPDGLFDQLLAILRSSLRSHLAAIAYNFLSTIDGTEKTWRAIRDLLDDSNPFSAQLLQLAGAARWFEAIDATGDIDRMIDDPAYNDVMPHLIARLSSDFPQRIFDLLTSRLDRGDPWIAGVRTGIEMANSEPWISFAIDHLGDSVLDIGDSKFDPLSTIFFHELINSNPRAATSVLRASIETTADAAIRAGDIAIEEALRRRGRQSIDMDDLDRLTEESNALNFVEELAPTIVRIASHVTKSGRQAWKYRSPDRHPDLDKALFLAFDRALTVVAATDPVKAGPMLNQLSDAGISSLDFLVCRAIGHLNADTAVDWLLDSPDRLEIGWLSNARWETRELIARVAASCSDDNLARLEAALMYVVPDHEKSVKNIRWRGLSEMELLSALPTNRISESTSKRLAELHRKYPEWSPDEPRGVSGGGVQSPIPDDVIEKLDDAQWLKAIAKYVDEDRLSFRNGVAVGGAYELATQLGSAGRQDPTRFVRFGLQLPAEAPTAFMEHLIRGVSGHATQAELLPLLEKFRLDAGDQAGRGIVAAIESYADEIDDGMLEMLLALATHPDPSSERAEAEGASNDYVSAGINGVRGAVASAIARVLQADHSLAERVAPAIKALAHDVFVAVRCLAAEAVLIYAYLDREDGFELAEELLADERVLSTNPGIRLLRYTLLWDADRFSTYLAKALALEDSKDAGGIWANSRVNGALGSVSDDVSELTDLAREGAADAISGSPGLDLDLTIALFDDPNPNVRQQAARALDSMADLSPKDADRLIDAFITSSSFPDLDEMLIDSLSDLPGDLPNATLEACRQVIDRLGSVLRQASMMLSGDMVDLLVRLYRAATPIDREQVLDLIDRTVVLQLWGFDRALDGAR